MNSHEALDYLERVVEAAADIDGGINDAIAVLAQQEDSLRRAMHKLGRATEQKGSLLNILRCLERESTDFVLGILPHLVGLPKGTFEELLSALKVAREVLEKEGGENR